MSTNPKLGQTQRLRVGLPLVQQANRAKDHQMHAINRARENLDAALRAYEAIDALGRMVIDSLAADDDVVEPDAPPSPPEAQTVVATMRPPNGGTSQGPKTRVFRAANPGSFERVVLERWASAQNEDDRNNVREMLEAGVSGEFVTEAEAKTIASKLT